jgi:two-component system sensor histidine kinase CpxA
MRPAFPLSLKISFWLLLNVLALAAIAAALLLAQFGLGMDALVRGPASYRLQQVAETVAADLAAAKPPERDNVLSRWGKNYGVRMALWGNTGMRIAGADLVLPSAIARRMRPPLIQNRMPAQRGRPDFEESPDLRGPPGLDDNPGVDGPEDPPPPRFDGRPNPNIRPPPDPEFDPPPRPLDDLAPSVQRGEGRPPPQSERLPPPRAGQRAGSNPNPGSAPRPGDPRRPEDGRGTFFLRTGAPASYWIGLRVPWLPDPARQPVPATLLVSAPSLLALARLFDWTPWLEAAAAAIVISALFWWPFVRGFTRSLSAMGAAADRIAEGRLDTRVDIRRRDEIGALGVAINGMAGRLEGLVTGQKRFLADAAHELCSPLSRLQLSVGILEARLPAEFQPALADIREEAQAMSQLTDALLHFSRAGLKPQKPESLEVELSALVQSAVDRESGGKPATVSVRKGLTVRADPDRLSRAIANLVRNAFSHGRGAEVEIVAKAEGDKVRLEISDRGPGIAPEHLARLGEAFYRPDPARTREMGGTGLGLAIVRESIAACGGTVRFATRPAGGFVAEILLPTR